MPTRYFVIGRSPEAAMRVEDEYASPKHARVWQDEYGQAWVEDLGSTNGTWLRQPTGTVRVLVPTKLYPGDVITVGRTEIPWQPDGQALTRDEVERLATYNAERRRGLMHTPEWQERMAELQRRFNGDIA